MALIKPRPKRRKKDSARLVWDSKPKRPPSPRDIEFQTAEIVIPNPGRCGRTCRNASFRRMFMII